MVADTAKSSRAHMIEPPLRGRHALVTGAGRGIGAAIANEIARLGADLTLVGRDPRPLIERQSEIAAAYGVSVRIDACDVSDQDSVNAMVAGAAAAFGPPLILVNNAGSGKSEPFHRMTLEHWRSMLSVNLDGVFNCTRAVIPHMVQARFGRIINVASTAGIVGYPYVAAYCAAKHGVIGLTRALALEYATRGITANAVCPGYTETDMTLETIANISAKTGRPVEQARAELAKHNPQGRLISPEEVASAVGYLALPASASITGQALPVAGGEVMP